MLSERGTAGQKKNVRRSMTLPILPSNCEGGSVRSGKDVIEPYDHAATSLHENKVRFQVMVRDGGEHPGGSDHAYQYSVVNEFI
jgi:hypothetical protein